MKKIIHLLIVAMLVFGTLQIAFTFNNTYVIADPPPPNDNVNGTQYIEGDWYVYGTESYTNETIILSGNLTINSGASLTLKNVTLAMNCSTANGTYAIYVYGSLDISDYDNDPATTNDCSNLTDSPSDADDRSPGDYKTALKAYSGASISITNSIIQDYGYEGGVDSYGIYTNFVNNVNIQNCTIENGFYGVYIDRGSNSRVNYNEIRYCDESAIYMGGDSYADILNNIIHHCDKGAFIEKWYSIVANNYIHNNSNVYDVNEQNQVGLRLQSADYCRVFNNTLEYNGKNWYGYTFQVYGCDYLKVYNNTFKNGKPGAGYSVLIQSSSDLTMYNNTIMNNPYTGVYLYYMSGNAKFYNNTIINNSGNGMYLQSFYPPTNFLIKDNYLDKNGWGIRFRQMRAYNITNNIITNCSGYGIYIDDVEGGMFSNNTINASGPDFHLQDSFGDPDTVFEVLNCSFDPTETDFGSVGPELVIYNYLHLNVTDASSWVPGAEVVVINNTDGFVYGGVSDDNGQVRFIPVKNMTITYYENISYDPVNITATLDSFEAHGEIEPIMDKSKTVNVHFYDDLPPLPPPFLTAVSNLTNVDLNWEPSPSNDVDHYLVYRNTTGGSWQLMYDSSTSPGKELWTNWTDYHAASDWASYRYYVTTVDMFPQESVSSNIARCGDWVVNSTKTVTDLTAPMNGSLVILPTGNLTLENVKIEFNCSFDGEYGIEILPDGKFWILDGDNNPLTTGDRTDIYSSNFHFYFNMQGIEFVMKNSRLSKCGLNESLQYSYWDHEVKGPEIMTVGEPSTRGLYIGSLTQTIIIENNEFSNNFVSLLIDGTNNASITGNTFSSNTFGIYLSSSRNNTIYDNTFTGHTGFPMYLFNSRNNNITYNDITNPSNTEAGIALNDDYCISNSFFYNDFSGGKYGIVAFDSGNLNNISHNNYSSQWTGVYLRYTDWTRIFDNDFDDTSSYDCNLESASFSRIFGGTSDLADIGLNLANSHNVVIWDLVVENATSSGIQLINSNNILITNVTMKSCGKGIDIGGGNTISMNEITMEDCTTGIYINSNPWNAEIIDSTIYLGSSTAIYINNCDNIEVTDCYLNATNYNFDLHSAQVTSYNTTFDQLKITLDSTSSISLWWRVDVRVFHWLGTPQQNVEVQIRNVAGTLIHTAWTDVNGYIGWIWIHERIQFSTSKESYTPHSFHAILGNHAGSNGLILNQSTVVTIWLENLPPTVSNVQITPSTPTTVDDLDLNYMYSDDEGDPEGATQILWYTDGIHNASLNDQMTISSTITRKDQTWFCEVIPHDGTMYGIPMTSTPVTIQNTPPEVSGVTIDEVSPRSSDNLHISYTFFDIDGDSEAQSQYRWYVDEGAGFYYSGVDSLELSSSYTKKGDLWKCIVTPNDGDDMGDSNESQVVTIGNSAPEVSDVIITPSSPQSNESLTVSYIYFDLDSDSESGSTIRWYLNDVLQSDLNDFISVDSSRTQKGEVWYYIVTPSDGEDFGSAIQSDSVMIGNTPPQVSNIVITPSNPTTEDDLNVTYDFFDNDGDSESLDTIIRWLRWTGMEYFDTGLRGKTLPSEHTFKGENWTCEVIPHDGWEEGTSTRSDMNVTIINSPPSVLGAEVKPSEPTSDTNLEVEYNYQDLDFDSESGSLIRWYKNGVLQEALNDSIMVDSSLTLKGEIWHYIVTPSDGEDFGDPFVSESKTIGNTPPYVMNIIISPLNPDTRDDLSISYDFYDSDGDSESLDTVVKWLRWSGSEFFDTGFRGKNLSAEHTLKGEMWTCEVIPHDGTGEGAVNRSDINVTINNSVPSVSNAYIMPSDPAADSNLIADYEFIDPDFDPESGSTIRWYKNGVLQENLNDSFSVDYTLTQGNDQWYYIITPSDGEITGDPVQSITVTIGNTPPKAFNVTISPSNPDTEDDLTVTYDFYDFDGDLESLDTVIRWLRWSGGVFFDTGLRGQTLPADYTSKGEIWICEVIPHDGMEAGEANRSEMNVTILNSQPSVINVYVAPSSPTSDSDLVADYEFVDPDLESESGSIIRWYKDGVEQWDLNDSTMVDHSKTKGNDQWYYIITPSDGEEYGSPVQSDTVVIGNTPPYVLNITISPLYPDTEDDLTVTYEFYDSDGDSESLDTTVKWLRWSGSNFFDTGYRGMILSSDHTSRAEVWTCEVIPHDGVDEGTATRSDMNVTIINSAPSVTNVYVTPSSPAADSDLNAVYEFIDPDFDSESGSLIRWYKDGVEQWDLNDSISVNYLLTTGNDQWYYIITPSDGEDFGEPVQSDTVMVGNTPPDAFNVTITPSDPDTEDDLMLTYDFYDYDGDLESLDTDIRWLLWSGIVFVDTGLRGKTLSSDYTSKGEMWTCEVIPHDGVDEGTATRADMNVTIGNTKPSVSNAIIIPSSPTADSDLEAEYEYLDPDNDLESGSTIRWFRNEAEQVDLYGFFTVNHSRTLKGDIWYYIITPSDGDAYGDAVESENITIGNTPPQVSNVAITPSDATALDDLIVAYDFYDSDGDSESLDTVIRWLRWSGSDFVDTGLRGKTLSSEHTSRAEIWACEVRPHDGMSEGITVGSSNVIIIANSPPTAQNALITPENPSTESDLLANYDYSDLDSDLEAGTVIHWFRDGVHVLELDSLLTVTSNYTQRGEVWNFTVRPSDGTNFGGDVKSENITIVNTQPSATDLTISPNPPLGDDNLMASYTFIDVDGDTEQDSEIRWYKNGILQGKYNDFFIVNFTDTQKGELWYFTLRVSDGFDYSGTISSYYVEVENSRPQIINLTPMPSEINISETNSYEFFVNVEDPDGDLMLFKWRIGKTTVSDDDYYLFETDYESAGTYILNLTIQDVGENSYTLAFEWQINVEDVNLPPQIEVKEPTLKNPKMKEGTSLKFIIDESDPDIEDTLQITWYFDGGIAQSGGSSYTYAADDLAAGEHVVKAVVDDGTDSVEYSWNLSVEDVQIEVTEKLLGQSYDWWGLLMAIISGIAAILLFVIGLIRVKKKKGALRRYMTEIDEISELKDEDPIGYENKINDLETEINDEFKQGRVEDLHFLMLQEIIGNKRGEIRRATVAQKFQGLPEGVTRELDEMLKDGKISHAEYEGFVATISQSTSLTPYQRKELSRMIGEWEVEDKGSIHDESPDDEDKTKKPEMDNDLDRKIEELENEINSNEE